MVIGGTSLSGGVGGVGGTILGALLMGVINNGLDLLNVSSYYQQIVKGLIIVGAVWLDRSQGEMHAKRRHSYCAAACSPARCCGCGRTAVRDRAGNRS